MKKYKTADARVRRFKTQRGSLMRHKGRNGETWRVRFRVIGSDGTSKEVSMTIGTVKDMTESQARTKLDGIVRKVNEESQSLRHFGLRGTLKHFVKHGSGAPNPDLKLGNIRGATGAISEMLVCADLLSKGIEVYRSINPQSACDLLCMIGDRPVRVEVKTAARGSRDGIVFCDLSNKQGRFDILATVTKQGVIRYTAHQQIRSDVSVRLGLLTECFENSAGGNGEESAGNPADVLN